MYARELSESLMHCRVSSLLSYLQKKVAINSFLSGEFNYCSLIWMFSSIRSYRQINKLHERSL